MIRLLHNTIFTVLLVLFMYPDVAFAQSYGNEWINFNQRYYSFPISSTGLKRINYDDLSNAGIPVGSFSHQQIQLFGRQKEVPIWVETNGDGTFDSGDYILFYAERNDGWLDSMLYLDPSKAANPAVSLFNDTIYYFFTWNNQVNNLRFTDELSADYANYTPVNYVWDKYEQGYQNSYLEGERLQSLLSSAFYVAGEGYGLAQVNGINGYNLDLTAQTPFPYTASGSPDARFKGLVTTTASSPVAQSGDPNHHTQWRINGQLVYDQTGFGCIQFKADLPFSTSGMTHTTDLDWTIVGDLPVETMYQSLTYWSIDYPRIPNFNGAARFKIRVENGSQTKNRVDYTALGVANPVIFSFGSSPRRIYPQANGGSQTILFPNNSGGSYSEIVAHDLNSAQAITGFSPVNATGFFTNYANIGHDRAYIIVYHPSLYPASNQYRMYRQSISGGGYNVVMANVEELYLQYGGGIKQHINGIRRFALHSYDLSTEKPEALLLLGKGLYPTIARGSGFNQNLIPTFGVPASDILITSNLPGTSLWKPLIPTGRISVNTEQGILNYLDKITTYEGNQNQNDVYDTPNKDWQKHIIHLIGGTDLSQQASFNAQMEIMKIKAEGDRFGGKVHTLKRESDDPIPPTQLQDIMTRIANGVSVMTYYGHKGVTNSGFEINLDELQNWNNANKYPLMIANSCYNGDLFELGLGSSSEYFVNTPNLGAIGYISSVSTGFHPMVGVYSNELYKQFTQISYSESIAKNMSNAIDTLESPGNMYMEVTATQMLLNGDPALKVNYHNRPEIELLEQNIFFKPDYVDLNTDSIEMHIALKNLGRSIIDSFSVEITRNFPGSDSDSIYHLRRGQLHYTDTVKIKFPLQPGIAAGLNVFDVKVDIPSFIPEQYDETYNNQVIKNYFLNLDGIVPVVPYEFAVVPHDTITLKASTINPIAEHNTYRFQIDTTDLFNSPFLKNAVVSGLGGVKEVKPNQWNSPLQLQDSMVYFWRVAVDEQNPLWKESSFQYIEGKSGWGQDHFFQFKKNTFSNVNYVRADRLREWSPDSVMLSVDVYPDAVYENAYYVNGTQMDYAVCTSTPALHVAVLDPVTFEPWLTNYNGTNPDHNFGNILCPQRNRPEKYFTFNQDNPAHLQSFQNMVLNEVPDGHYLLIYAPIMGYYSSWNALDSANMYQTFAALGSDSIIPGRPDHPFSFFVRKGYPNTVVERVIDPTTGAGSENGYAYIHMEAYMPTSITQGQETSTLIGPAMKWGNVYWRQESIDPVNNSDTTRLLIQPYTWDLIPGIPVNVLFSNNDSLINLQGMINPQQYPYIRLRANYKDTTNYTPAQVDSWHVLYDLAPEAAIDGTNGYYFSHLNDSIYEGESLKFAADIRNIFEIDMDSLLVNYWVQDNNNVKHVIDYPRKDSLRVGQTLRDTITFSSAGLSGINSLWIEVNPYINGSLYIKDQPEQYHFNNVLQIPFYVNGDNENPLLDVTFDGRHILNGDIVNPNAEILITLKDENPYLIMDEPSDTTLFGIYLTDPAGNQKRIPFVDGMGNTVMQWLPAESTHKRFKIVYPAAFTMDGKYRLLVQGADKSGNLSGDFQYKVDFEVIRASSITHMMNYPNPFSTSTRFVFTLTGTDVPDDIIIQIMTVSGRVVREITEDQLGRIYIGRNVTEYAWDGRDEFGDQLANGVYLYTVKAKINGEDIDHRESGADQYFKKNFGKMYLMR